MIEITLEGVPIVLDVEADLSMGDLGEDMDAIAGLISWYGRVLAGARRQLDDASDTSKHMIARFMEDRFARDPKAGIEKTKIAAEASNDWTKQRRAVSAARELVGRLDAAYTALQVKADILRSKGALARSELDTTEMSTPAHPRARPTDADRHRGVAEAMRRKRDAPEVEPEIDDED